MKCKDCEEKLDRFVDRELSPTEVLELQLHLESCPDCTEHYDFQVHLKRLVRIAGQPEGAPVQRVEMCQCLFREGSLCGTFRHQ